MNLATARVTVQPATSERWDDLERLFGRNGACGGCWCMYWRRSARDFAAGKGEGNRRALRRLVGGGAVPGLLAYAGDEPIGWCAIAPRSHYPRFEKSRTLKPIDDRPVWSVTCFFVARDWRHRGVSVRLLNAAVKHARKLGARIVEGYPVEATGEAPGPFVWTGLAAAFRAAGFVEAARPSKNRPIMRRGA